MYSVAVVLLSSQNVMSLVHGHLLCVQVYMLFFQLNEVNC